MLRSWRLLSPAVCMVLQSLEEIKPYLIVVFIGVFAFSDAFKSINQVLYIKSAESLASSDDNYMEPLYDRDLDVSSIYDARDKYLGEFLMILRATFIGSVIGFEGEGTELWTDLQWFLYFVAIVFNAIVLMNILLALVGETFSEVHGKKHEYTYKQLVN